MKPSVLLKKRGRKTSSVFKCRRGVHRFRDAGQVLTEDGTIINYRWCSICGALEEDKQNDVSSPTLIHMPDIAGI